MPKPSNRAGVPATPRQKGSLSKGPQKASDARAERAAVRKAERLAAKAAEEEKVKPRWKQLEDGDISLKDLSDEELKKQECANSDGSWEGKRHQLDGRIRQRMYNEQKRRYRATFDDMTPAALEAFADMIDDVDNPAQRLAASKLVIEHQIGKVPEVVHIAGETEYDRLQQSAFRIMRGPGSLADIAAKVIGQGQEEDIVDAEWTEESGEDG